MRNYSLDGRRSSLTRSQINLFVNSKLLRQEIDDGEMNDEAVSRNRPLSVCNKTQELPQIYNDPRSQESMDQQSQNDGANDDFGHRDNQSIVDSILDRARNQSSLPFELSKLHYANRKQNLNLIKFETKIKQTVLDLISPINAQHKKLVFMVNNNVFP